MKMWVRVGRYNWSRLVAELRKGERIAQEGGRGTVAFL